MTNYDICEFLYARQIATVKTCKKKLKSYTFVYSQYTRFVSVFIIKYTKYMTNFREKVTATFL